MENDRICFSSGEQKEFVATAIERAGSATKVAELLNLSTRTVRDWRREKFLISYRAVMLLSKTYGINLPENLELQDEFWYTTKGAHQGGIASYKKQGGMIGGDPVVRQQKWREWWEREGHLKLGNKFQPLPFSKPENSIALAEFIGIMMGDGGVTKRQISISLHHINDLEYSKFVVGLIKKLFSLTPSVYHRPEVSINIITVSRSNLVKYLHEIGLPIGNKIKQNLNIPDWIQENDEYMIACIRGLVDTDGSVFTHRYRVNGKMYFYKKICFSSSSPPLIATVQKFLEGKGFYARISRSGKHIRIESKKGVKRYFDLIGTHNPKHLKRYHN